MQIKYNYLIYNKIKFLFFLLKSVEIIKLLYICNVKKTHKQPKTKQQ